MLEEELSCLGKAQCLKKDRSHLARTWQHKKNCKYLKAHHNAYFSTFVGLGGGSGSMSGKYNAARLVPGNENNYYDRDETTEELKIFIVHNIVRS